MKKLFSLIRASMTSDMSLFKFHSKKNSKKTKILVTFFIAFGLMISIWVYANIFFEKLAIIAPKKHDNTIGITGSNISITKLVKKKVQSRIKAHLIYAIITGIINKELKSSSNT